MKRDLCPQDGNCDAPPPLRMDTAHLDVDPDWKYMAVSSVQPSIPIFGTFRLVWRTHVCMAKSLIARPKTQDEVWIDLNWIQYLCFKLAKQRQSTLYIICNRESAVVPPGFSPLSRLGITQPYTPTSQLYSMLLRRSKAYR